MVFGLDRALSLNFGRSCVIQDHDVVASRPDATGAPADPMTPMVVIFVELAYLQGDTYRLLFSNQAQLETTETRSRHARSLAALLLDLRARIQSASITHLADTRTSSYNKIGTTSRFSKNLRHKSVDTAYHAVALGTDIQGHSICSR